MSGLLTRPLGRPGDTDPPAGAETDPEPAAYAGRTGVNLLSPWVREGLRVRALRKRFAYALLALVVAKLLLVDMSSAEGWQRIVTFIAVGILMLVIGYFVPLPPRKEEAKP